MKYHTRLSVIRLSPFAGRAVFCVLINLNPIHGRITMRMLTFIFVLVFGFADNSLAADNGEVNIYSSRHYDSDDALFETFAEQTGIKVNVIKGKADELLARLKREGDLSPADIFITVDAGRLQKGIDAKIFQPVESKVLSERIPENLRHPDGLWFALTVRIRCIFLSKDVSEDYVTTYAGLADPKVKGELLIRSSSNIYNQSLVAWLIGKQGKEKAQAWTNGVVANMARKPQGGDTDQLRALAAGEGKVAVANHYYYAFMLKNRREGDADLAKKIRIVFPNQKEGGTQVNVSGAGIVKTAPNKANAIKFLEYMTTVEAQEAWVANTYEYPVVKDAKPAEVVRLLGTFKTDDLNAAVLGDNNREAVQTMDRANWR
ncbi:extracellular solute-binding protein [Poriferisphaera sp. WC338]|uniref:extracellular solute-binding protein n=1 Tax=Poriferisphaera sp. WC338 TaxID=3425129 RepID=UPI003D815602